MVPDVWGSRTKLLTPKLLGSLPSRLTWGGVMFSQAPTVPRLSHLPTACGPASTPPASPGAPPIPFEPPAALPPAPLAPLAPPPLAPALPPVPLAPAAPVDIAPALPWFPLAPAWPAGESSPGESVGLAAPQPTWVSRTDRQ